MPYQVVAPLVITKKQDGSDLYLYHRAFLPDFASEDEVKRLLDEKFVEKVGADEAPAEDSKAKAPAKKPGPAAPSN